MRYPKKIGTLIIHDTKITTHNKSRSIFFKSIFLFNIFIPFWSSWNRRKAQLHGNRKRKKRRSKKKGNPIAKRFAVDASGFTEFFFPFHLIFTGFWAPLAAPSACLPSAWVMIQIIDCTRLQRFQLASAAKKRKKKRPRFNGFHRVCMGFTRRFPTTMF